MSLIPIPGYNDKKRELHLPRFLKYLLIFVISLGVIYASYFILTTLFAEFHEYLLPLFKDVLWGIWFACEKHSILVSEHIQVLAGSTLYSAFITYIASAIKKGQVFDALVCIGRFFTSIMVVNFIIFIAAIISLII